MCCLLFRNEARTAGLLGDSLCIKLVALCCWHTDDVTLVCSGDTLDKSDYSILLQQCLRRVLLRVACISVGTVFCIFLIGTIGLTFFNTGNTLLSVVGIFTNGVGWCFCTVLWRRSFSRLRIDYVSLVHEVQVDHEFPWEPCSERELACAFLRKKYLK